MLRIANLGRKSRLNKIDLKVNEDKVKRRNERGNYLPPDEYRNEIEPLELKIDEETIIEFNVKRKGEYGLVCLDMRERKIDNEEYEGYTKNGLSVKVNHLEDIIDMLEWVKEECNEKKLIEPLE